MIQTNIDSINTVTMQLKNRWPKVLNETRPEILGRHEVPDDNMLGLTPNDISPLYVVVKAGADDSDPFLKNEVYWNRRSIHIDVMGIEPEKVSSAVRTIDYILREKVDNYAHFVRTEIIPEEIRSDYVRQSFHGVLEWQDDIIRDPRSGRQEIKRKALRLDNQHNGYMTFDVLNPTLHHTEALARYNLDIIDGVFSDSRYQHVVEEMEDDTTPPILSLFGDATMTLEVGSTFTDPGYAAIDNRDGDITDSVVVTGTVDMQTTGEYTLEYNVRDSSNNAAVTQYRTIIIQDTISPVITLTGATSITLEVGLEYTEPGYSAADNYDGDITSDVVVSGDTVDTSSLGTYTIRYDVTDDSNNMAVTRTRTIMVVDTTPPVITLSGEATMVVESGSTFTDPGYTATDNYDGDITSRVVVTGTVNTAVVGEYVRRYNVVDSSNNAAIEKTRIIAVVNTTAPIITLTGETTITLEVGSSYTEPGYSAIDDNDGDVTSDVVITGDTVDTSTPGTYVIRYDVTDSNGNEAITRTRTIIIRDTTAPVITLTGASTIMLEIGSTFVDPGYTATDNLDGDITSDVVVSGDTVDGNTLGTYVIRYDVTDDANNAAIQQTRTVVVQDTTLPVITLSGSTNIIIEFGESYADPGYSASDNHGGDITEDVVVTGSVDTSTVGTYVIRYNVRDDSNNAAVEQIRTITVQDTVPPVITLSGNAAITHEAGTTYTDAGASATDNYDGDITGNIVVSGDTVDIGTEGIYTIHYDVRDSSNNAATRVTRTVRVEDSTPPVITLSGSANIILEFGESYADPGVSASDTLDGDLTSSIVVSGDTVDDSTLGTYTVNYDASDAAGNNAVTVTRTIIIRDTTPPVITLTGGDITLEAGATFTDPGYSAADNYDGDITSNVVVTGTVNTSELGTYVLNYDVMDSSNNAATRRVRTITVQDTTPPVFTLTGGTAIFHEAKTTFTDPGYTLTDNRDTVEQMTIEVTGTVDIDTLGDNTINYSAEDREGNVGTATRTVTVRDTTPPVITLTGGDVTLDVGETYTDPGFTATDTFDGDVTANVTVTGDDVDTSTAGTYTRNYNVSDSSGNDAVEVTRTITVETVLMGDPPGEIPFSIFFIGVTSTSLTPFWIMPSSGGEITDFLVEYRRAIDTELIEAGSTTNTQFPITGLTPSTTYYVQITARGPGGNSSPLGGSATTRAA